MKSKWISSTLVVLAGAGLALAQTSAPDPKGTAPAPASAAAAAPDPANGAAPAAEAKSPFSPMGASPAAPFPVYAPHDDGGPAVPPGHYDPSAEIPYSLTSRLYGNVEFIEWWQRHTLIPTLLPVATPVAGDIRNMTDFGGRAGARATVGFFCDPEQDKGFEATYFFLGKGTQDATLASDALGNPMIPRFRTVTVFTPPMGLTGGIPVLQSVPVSLPGSFAGAVHQREETSAWGAEFNGRCQICSVFSDRAYFLAGFRHFQLNEQINVSDVSTALPTIQSQLFFPGDQIRAVDNFNVHNQFYGPQVGVAAEYFCGRFGLDATLKSAFGAVHEVVDITGGTLFTPVGGAETLTPKGSLATENNIGKHSRDIFAWMPEATANLGYQFTPLIKGYVGFNYLYLSNAVRAGNLTGGTFAFSPTAYYAYGFNAGLQVRY